MRWMLTIVGLAAIAVSQLPNTRQTPAAASDGAYASPEVGLQETTPAAEPLTVCTDEGCYVVRQPVRSVVRSRTVYRSRPVVYQQVVSEPVVYRSVVRQPVFSANERFMQRGPARRVVGKAARVVTAPVRWLRCR